MSHQGRESHDETARASPLHAPWKAIAVTQSTDWVMRSGACPDTNVWRDWLLAAQKASLEVRLLKTGGIPGTKTWELPNWDPKKCLNALISPQKKSDREDTDDLLRSMTEQMSGAALPDYNNILLEPTPRQNVKRNDAGGLTGGQDSYWGQRWFPLLKRALRPSVPAGYRRIEWSCVSRAKRSNCAFR